MNMKLNFNKLNRNNLSTKPETNELPQPEHVLKQDQEATQSVDIKQVENEVAEWLLGNNNAILNTQEPQKSAIKTESSSTQLKQDENGFLDEKITPLTESDMKVEEVLYSGDPSDIKLDLSETAIENQQENQQSVKNENNVASVNESFYTQDEQTYNQAVFKDNQQESASLDNRQEEGENVKMTTEQEPSLDDRSTVSQTSHSSDDSSKTSEALENSHANDAEQTSTSINDVNKKNETPHVPNVSSSQEINQFLDKTKDNSLTAMDLEQLQVIIDKIKASNPQAQIEEFEALKKKDSKLDQEIYGHKVLAKQNEELLEKLLKQMKEISGKETVEEFAYYVQSVIENNESEIKGYRQYIAEKEAILIKINEDLAKL